MSKRQAHTEGGCRIILAGVGGQGILFVTRLLTEAALSRGYRVMGSETHGMAQRGGSVVSHLKLGRGRSPLVRATTADLLLAFERNEFYRTLRYLKKGGVCFVNIGAGNIPKEISNYMKRMSLDLYRVDATRIALDRGVPLAANLVLLGFAAASSRLTFGSDELQEAISRLSPQRFKGANDRAFRLGAEQWKGDQH